MEDDFSSGWERKIVNNITNEDYDNYPLELGVVVNNVSTIYAIYKALKYNECLTERTITFAGDMLKKELLLLGERILLKFLLFQVLVV